MISTLHRGYSHLPYSMIITKIYEHFGKKFSKEKGHLVLTSNIIFTFWAKNLNFYVISFTSKSSLKKKAFKHVVTKEVLKQFLSCIEKESYDSSSKPKNDQKVSPQRLIQNLFCPKREKHILIHMLLHQKEKGKNLWILLCLIWLRY